MRMDLPTTVKETLPKHTLLSFGDNDFNKELHMLKTSNDYDLWKN